MQNERTVTCPYNEVHRICPSRMAQHLIKCSKQYPNMSMSICPFNATHHVKDEDFPAHISECRDKDVVERSMFIRENPDVVQRHGAPASGSEEGAVNISMENKQWDVDNNARPYNPRSSLMYREDILGTPPHGLGKSGRGEWRNVDRLRIQRLRDGKPIDDLVYPAPGGGTMIIYDVFGVIKEEDGLLDLEKCSLQARPVPRPPTTEPPKLRRPHFLDMKVAPNIEVEESDNESNTDSSGSFGDHVMPSASRADSSKKRTPFDDMAGPPGSNVSPVGDVDQLSDISSVSSCKSTSSTVRQKYFETLRAKAEKSCKIQQTDEVEGVKRSRGNSIDKKSTDDRNCENVVKVQPNTGRRKTDTVQRLIFKTRQLP